MISFTTAAYRHEGEILAALDREISAGLADEGTVFTKTERARLRQSAKRMMKHVAVIKEGRATIAVARAAVSELKTAAGMIQKARARSWKTAWTAGAR